MTHAAEADTEIMPNSGIHELSRSLGALEGKFGMMQEAVDQLKADQAETTRVASETNGMVGGLKKSIEESVILCRTTMVEVQDLKNKVPQTDALEKKPEAQADNPTIGELMWSGWMSALRKGIEYVFLGLLALGGYLLFSGFFGGNAPEEISAAPVIEIETGLE